MRVFLSPAQHGNDNKQCAICGSENAHSRRFADTLLPKLQAVGVDVKLAPENRGGLQKQIDAANHWGADLYLVFHSNAYNKKVRGLRVLTSDSIKSQRIATQLCEELNKGLPDYTGAKAKVVPNSMDLWEIRGAIAPVMYCEMFFHDNADDMRFYHNNMGRIADCFVRFVCAQAGKPVKPNNNSDGASIKPGDRFLVQPEVRVNTQSDGQGVAGVTVSGVYTALEKYPIYPHRSHGVHADNIGWVPWSHVHKHTSNKDEIINVGDTVIVSPKVRVNTQSDGKGAQGKTIGGQYTVDRIVRGASYGLHVGGMGWIPWTNACKL